MLLACIIACAFISAEGLLFPQENEHRQLKELDGLWWFVREPSNSDAIGFANSWFNHDFSDFENATKLPVPCAYNDLTQDIQLRDHVGWVWYQRTFFVPSDWQQRRVVIRFGSVNYFAAVFINGHNVINHTGGHLPFEVDINDIVSFTSSNRVTVAVNNTLSHATIPPGEFVYKKGGMAAVAGKKYQPWTANHIEYPPGFFVQTPGFDFFNYAGILRPVYLYATQHIFIKDMHIVTTIDGILNYTVNTVGMSVKSGDEITVRLRDRRNEEVAVGNNRAGTLVVDNPQLWWPIGMGQRPGYLYTLEVTLYAERQPVDIYRLSVGIRDVKVGKSLEINGKPFYCQGFGMHEDSEIHGRGFDRAVMVKDLNLVQWMGGNCYRTSHYPYSEERQFEADRRGIAVFAETPAVGVKVFNKPNELLHQQMLRELIERDRNHPSVIVWSVSNEPHTYDKKARSYFQ
uniref:Beta-glucuronidase n=1 Tax=Plectus sambesii TaxID=2011161 RepID=A0A914UZP8_9BILA